MVTSSFLAGAEMITFFTGPRRCFLASSALVKRPVDSSTTCAPTESQGSLAGSFSAKTRRVRPSTRMQSVPALMSLLRLPRMESYLSRWARVLGSVRSLTATNSILRSLSAARSTLRPMRPNPLMPTLIAIKPPNECEIKGSCGPFAVTKNRNIRIAEEQMRGSAEHRGTFLQLSSLAQRRTCFGGAGALDGGALLSTTAAQYVADKARDVLQGGAWASGYVSGCVAAGKARAAVRSRGKIRHPCSPLS